ncbi:Linoleate 9S-lipoxygenase 1 [Hibiscus syriacus]|uniref:Lipoxygenase n=1 Tax=Hibiscus syriacus TaxID=106335 RepID=A0A6A3ALT0_HIBSY|nr:probable linoleate 9S-lipoxygenase 5 isoform X1 [Hibiscus syriacus]KAE8705564.1 Linoleate 9S-lipoxygenase 1 [Hibiscus syriacus]
MKLPIAKPRFVHKFYSPRPPIPHRNFSFSPSKFNQGIEYNILSPPPSSSLNAFPFYRAKQIFKMTSLLPDAAATADKTAKSEKIKGTVILMKKNALDLKDLGASVLDGVDELIGNRVSLQLISAENGDAANEFRGKVGKPAYLEHWSFTDISPVAGESKFSVNFDWDEEIGKPGALLIKNNHHTEFYLRSITLERVPGHGRIHFVCNSWVYPGHKYEKPRLFFTNETYLPHEMPKALRKSREEELNTLRGNGKGELQEWDRVYDYAYYNDLGDPDKGPDYARPVLGGSAHYPYPRRGRTGRPPAKSDPNTESRLPLSKIFDIYVPRDERFGRLKFSDFLSYFIKSGAQSIPPELKDLANRTDNEFQSFGEVLDLYYGGIKIPSNTLLDTIINNIPLELLKQIFRTDGEQLLKFPVPKVIQDNLNAWRTDEEFAREMLAGVNPVIIRLLEEFPPTSKLDPRVYGDQNSSITKEHIEHNLEGLTIHEALKTNRLFILDHHDSLMPYIRKINSTSTKTYASRTVLLLRDDGTLKPLAIELSSPDPKGDQYGAVSKVYTPAQNGVEGSIWLLAKTYVAVNDSAAHELITHWLKTHATIEPFVIAANRQLSVVHPIHKLLHPHFRDTMYINAVAREILINGGGLLEFTVFPAKYSMEWSSAVYKDWNFLDQALPSDLKKRGVAVHDKDSPNGLRLLIKDYPYAVDGLEIWFAIEQWVQDYCSFYYKNDEMVQQDPELQAWWKEVREQGHGDKKDEPWWPKMQTRKDLIHSCSIIIWLSSALHAATNFGQYPYAGYPPNRPTITRRFMPEKGTPEYTELESIPDKFFLKTIAARLQSVIGIALIEILSRHSSDEVYLGQRDTPEWTLDKTPLAAFKDFGERLSGIEEKIVQMNNDKRFKNRVGPANMPYTLLYPSSGVGITGKGIPNSIAI